MKTLIIINDGPYGTEKAYNAMRIAIQTNKEHEAVEVQIFLMADGVNCAIANQTTPNGFYNIEKMLMLAVSKGSKIKLCGSCADARGISSLQLVKGAELSNMSELTNWIVEADKVLIF